MILAALAAGAGIVRGVNGILSAGSNARRDRDLIKRAYQISKRRLNQQQGDVRESTGESLNARGVFNGGANSGDTPEVAAAKAPAAPPGKGFIGKVKGAVAKKDAYEQQRMAGDATRGQTGAAGTLSGQVESDLSGEFLGEQQDLWNERIAAINATKRQQSSDVVNSIGQGIDTAASVYNAGSLIQGALAAKNLPATGDLGADSPGAQVRFPHVPSESGSGQAIGGTFFGGYDPVDPLGIWKRNDEFNVYHE